MRVFLSNPRRRLRVCAFVAVAFVTLAFFAGAGAFFAFVTLAAAFSLAKTDELSVSFERTLLFHNTCVAISAVCVYNFW